MRNNKSRKNQKPKGSSKHDAIINNSKKFDGEKARLQKQIEIEYKKRELDKLKISNFFANISEIVVAILKILGLIAFVLLLLATIAFGVLWAWLFSHGQIRVADNVMMVLQLFTGVTSVAVGIWALVLTIISRSESRENNSNLNIKMQSSNDNVQAMPHELDINPKSLG